LINNIELAHSIKIELQYQLSAVPSLLGLMITLDTEDQKQVVNDILYRCPFETPDEVCYKLLLKLNLRVNLLANQPHKVAAFNAANELQKTLISSLKHYVAHSKQENALPELQSQWKRAIQTASVTLKHYDDWNTFLLNLGLVLLSIPMLGLPLVINYYRTDYKHVFFQTKELCLLEQFDKIVPCPKSETPVVEISKM
jgi:hypothetical protein